MPSSNNGGGGGLEVQLAKQQLTKHSGDPRSRSVALPGRPRRRRPLLLDRRRPLGPSFSRSASTISCRTSETASERALLSRHRVLRHRAPELVDGLVEPRPQLRRPRPVPARPQLVGQDAAGQTGLPLPPRAGCLVAEVVERRRLARRCVGDLVDAHDEPAVRRRKSRSPGAPRATPSPRRRASRRARRARRASSDQCGERCGAAIVSTEPPAGRARLIVGPIKSLPASIRSSSERRTSHFRWPARIARSVPFEIHERIVAGLIRSSSAISASVSQGSSWGSGFLSGTIAPHRQ